MKLKYLSPFLRTEFQKSSLEFLGYNDCPYTIEYIQDYTTQPKHDFSNQFSRFKSPVTFYKNPNLDYSFYRNPDLLEEVNPYVTYYTTAPDYFLSKPIDEERKFQYVVSSKTASSKEEAVNNAKYECFAYAITDIFQLMDALRHGRTITSVVGDDGHFFDRNWRAKANHPNIYGKHVYIRAINTPLPNPDKNVDMREDGMLFRYMIRKDMFLSSQILIVDIDNVAGCPSVLELVGSLKYKPTIAFSTMSDNKLTKRKFRLLYLFDEPIESPAIYELAAERLNQIVSESQYVNECDNANKNVAQLFFGTRPDAEMAWTNICYTNEWVEELAGHKFLNDFENIEKAEYDGFKDFNTARDEKERLFIKLFVNLSAESYNNTNRTKAFKYNLNFLLHIQRDYFSEQNLIRKYKLTSNQFSRIFEYNQNIENVIDMLFFREKFTKKTKSEINWKNFSDILEKYQYVYPEETLKESISGQFAAINSIIQTRRLEQHDKLSFVPDDMIKLAYVHEDNPEILFNIFSDYMHSKEFGLQLEYCSSGNSFVIMPDWFVQEFITDDIYGKGDDRKLKVAKQIVSMRFHDSLAPAEQIFLRALKWSSKHIHDEEGPDKKITIKFLARIVNKVCQSPINELRKKYYRVFTRLSEWVYRKNAFYHRSDISKRGSMYEFLDYIINCNLTIKDNIKIIKKISGIDLNEQYIMDYCRDNGIKLLTEDEIKRRDTLDLYMEIFETSEDADDAYEKYLELKRNGDAPRQVSRKTMDHLWNEWKTYGEIRTVDKLFSKKLKEVVEETDFSYGPDLAEKTRITHSKMRGCLNMTMNSIRVDKLMNYNAGKGYFRKKNKGVATFELLYDKLYAFREFVWTPEFIGAIVNRDSGVINRFFKDRKLEKDVFEIINF